MTRIRRRRVQNDAPLSNANPDRFLEGLNPEQTEVVLAHEGCIRVLAGAGAGKTRALVNRVGYLVEGRGVNPREILAVTFSTKAAGEMSKRLYAMGVARDARIGTWHSLAWQILREERPELSEWQVDDRDRFKFAVKDVLGWQGMKWHTADLTVVLSYIGRCKADCAEPGTDAAKAIAERLFEAKPCGQHNPQLLAEAYWRAHEVAMQRRLVTFDDMLLWTWRLFRDDEEARLRWSGRYRYLLQDEAQDANLVQAYLAEFLAREHRNYMVVGDPAQSIYGFRGAHPEKLRDFEEEWAPVTTIRMCRNYRSGREVIEAANRLTTHMAEGTHLGVDMVAERGTAADVRVSTFADQDEEGETIARELLAAHEDGAKWGSMAVLYRTNAQSRGIEEACLGNKIPYVVLGGTNFYDRREVKDLLAYLRLAEGRGTEDDFRRAINSPFRYLGKAFVSRVSRASGESWPDAARRAARGARIQQRQVTSVEEWAGLIEGLARSIEIRDSLQGALEAGPAETAAERDRIPASPTDDVHAHMPAALLERIIRETDYMRYITRDEGAETVENNRVSNVRELVRAAARFTAVRELLDYVDGVLEAARKAKTERHPNRVTLCSLHRSKGLEWPIVAIIGANEKILPHGRSEDIEEERRLFYVGVTRAMDVLRVTCVHQAAFGAKLADLEPSRFIEEAGLDLPAVAVAS